MMNTDIAPPLDQPGAQPGNGLCLGQPPWREDRATWRGRSRTCLGTCSIRPVQIGDE